ncbi:MAG TPA: MFS transporter [Bryobacteraceae bacterium]|jgi:MFS family permease|nr:MFS transporter [Bryobacteraceae bacterium]
MASLALAVRALRSRNYRLFFSGQIISLVGTQMTRVAMSWLVYRLTSSAVLLGVVSFASMIPTFLLGPIAGVWVDRWDRHRTLVWTQSLSMIQSLALAALALTGTAKIWEIICLALMQGLVNAFDMPARQSFVVQMVDRREDLGNAIALNGSMVNAAGLVGPAIAGVLIAAVGEGYCFLADGLSYIAVIISLLSMKIAVPQARRAQREIGHELREGWQYVRGSLPIRSILINLGLVSMFGMSYSVLMPVFAVDVMHGGPNTLGFLMSAVGVGALVGTISLTMRKTIVGLGRRIAIATALCGAALIAFGFSRLLLVSLAILPFLGFGLMQQMAPSNTILQTIVDDEKRGRVMSFYSMAFLGMAPFGSLLAGNLAAKLGAPRTVMINGVVCLIGSLWFRWRLPAIRQVVRPIYVRMGILPEEIVSGQ